MTISIRQPIRADPRAVETLLAALPQQWSVAGARTLRRIMDEVLPVLPLNLQPNSAISGIDDAAWQRIWACLVKVSPSYGARRRYKRLLLEVARAWQAAGLIADLPEFEVPPRHHRRLTVRVDRLGGYRFSDYECLRATLVDAVCGKGNAIAPPMLSAYPQGVLAMILILCGVCSHGAISLLTELTWADVPLHPNLPLRLPRRGRQGWVWLGLPPLARLFLLSAYFRAGKPAPEERVIAIAPKALNHELRLLLTELCQVAKVPVLLPSQLIQFVRLDLRQCLPNLNLAVLMGLVKFTPVAADQVSDVLRELGVTLSEWAKTLWEWIGSSETLPLCEQLPQAETELEDTEQPDEEDSLLTTYDQLLDEIRPHVRALCQPKPTKRSRDFLEKWACSTPPADLAQQDVARFNLAWLVRWLLGMTKDRRLKPVSRAVYWSAILQMVRVAPACNLHELEQCVMPELLEQGYSMSRVTRVAWLRLRRFLSQASLPMPEIAQHHWKTQASWKPARVLLAAQQKTLLAALSGTPLGRACYLAQQAGLRVSEVCRLKTNDLVLAVQPYLVIRRSKRGRNRRVDLAHLPPAHLDRQRQHQASRRREGAPSYLADAEGQPLVPKVVSEAMRKALEAANLQDILQGDQELRFHSWRAAAAEAFYQQSGDVRHVATQLGHVLAATTVGSYLHTLDLQSIPLLLTWYSPLNKRDLYLPVLVLANLLGRTGRRIVQMVQEFNAANPGHPITLTDPENLSDGPRPARPGRKANYLGAAEILRLLVWSICKGL